MQRRGELPVSLVFMGHLLAHRICLALGEATVPQTFEPIREQVLIPKEAHHPWVGHGVTPDRQCNGTGKCVLTQRWMSSKLLIR